MTDSIIRDLTAILTAIVSLAIVAVIVSNHANSAGVITSAGSAFSAAIKAAVSPVSS